MVIGTKKKQRKVIYISGDDKIMIYITGDTHSDFTRFTEEQFPIQTEMKKDDYIIICGDFGGVWTFKANWHYDWRKKWTMK